MMQRTLETIFRKTALLTSHHAKATTRKANRASHGPRVLAKERAKKVRDIEHPKEHPKVPRVTIVRTKVRVPKIGLSGRENPKAETSQETQETPQTCHDDKSYADNAWFDDGWSCDEWNDGWEESNVNSAGSFSLFFCLILVR